MARPFIARWLALLWAALVAFLLTLPGSDLPALPNFLPELVARYADKVVHLGLFAVLAFLLLAARGGRHAFQAVGIATLYGGLLEVVQAWIPGRDPSWADLAADLIGAALALVVWSIAARRRDFGSAR